MDASTRSRGRPGRALESCAPLGTLCSVGAILLYKRSRTAYRN